MKKSLQYLSFLFCCYMYRKCASGGNLYTLLDLFTILNAGEKIQSDIVSENIKCLCLVLSIILFSNHFLRHPLGPAGMTFC